MDSQIFVCRACFQPCVYTCAHAPHPSRRCSPPSGCIQIPGAPALWEEWTWDESPDNPLCLSEVLRGLAVLIAVMEKTKVEEKGVA